MNLAAADLLCVASSNDFPPLRYTKYTFKEQNIKYEFTFARFSKVSEIVEFYFCRFYLKYTTVTTVIFHFLLYNF